MIEADAPGKLVICGEYAVLAGAPAIAVAMGIRARARVAAASQGRLDVADGGSWRFSWRDGMPVWGEVPPDGQGRILEAVATTLVGEGLTLSAPLEIALDTRAFSVMRPAGRRDKLGLGSSAALVASLTAALLAHAKAPVPQRESLFRVCERAHRRFQAGAGSGIDIAAAVHGGVVALIGAGGEVRRLAWPAGLAWLAVWSGESASTQAMLARFEAFRRADPVRFDRQADMLRGIAETVMQAWECEAVSVLLRALADYDDALRAFDEGARLGIYTPEHERLARLAAREGAVYKISGAGGGDFGLAFADSPAVIERIGAALARENVLTLPGTAGAVGVTVR